MLANDKADPNPNAYELAAIAELIREAPGAGVKAGMAVDVVDNVVDAVRDAGNAVTDFANRVVDNAVANARADSEAVREGRMTPITIEITRMTMTPQIADALATLETPEFASVDDLLRVRQQLAAQ